MLAVGAAGRAARDALLDVDELHVPAVFLAECVSAVRSLLRRGEIDARRARAALSRIRVLRVREYRLTPFIDRVWQLRGNLTVYDAWYVALAEQLGTDLVTADERLVRAPGVRCAIHHVAR